MHCIFILYGIKDAVDLLIRDMQSQKMQIPYKSPDGEIKKIWMQGQLRLLPFGVYEYIFPKEQADLVLTTLNFKNKDVGHASITFKQKLVLNFIRRMLNAEDAPDFKTDKQLVWLKNNVSIIPIGVRYDGEITDPDGQYKGCTHEAI